MIRPSFIPPRAIRELRDFTRRRKQMIGIAAEERNRVQKVLEDANVKIGDVLSDVFGLSGQLMLEALVNGLGAEEQPSAFDIAQLARGHARKKLKNLSIPFISFHASQTVENGIRGDPKKSGHPVVNKAQHAACTHGYRLSLRAIPSGRRSGGTRRFRRKAAAFIGWHEPDKSRGLRPVL